MSNGPVPNTIHWIGFTMRFFVLGTSFRHPTCLPFWDIYGLETVLNKSSFLKQNIRIQQADGSWEMFMEDGQWFTSCGPQNDGSGQIMTKHQVPSQCQTGVHILYKYSLYKCLDIWDSGTNWVGFRRVLPWKQFNEGFFEAGFSFADGDLI